MFYRTTSLSPCHSRPTVPRRFPGGRKQPIIPLLALLQLLSLLFFIPPQPLDPSPTDIEKERHGEAEHHEDHRLRKLVSILVFTISAAQRSVEHVLGPEIAIAVDFCVPVITSPLQL